MNGLLLVALGLASLLAIGLKRTYSRVSLKELKVRAREGDKISGKLIKAVGFGPSLNWLLWLWILVTSAGFFVAVSRLTTIWTAFTASVLLILIGFIWLPSTSASFLSRYLAANLAPLLAGILGYTQPVTRRLEGLYKRLRPNQQHTGLFDKTDIIDFLNRQETQTDSRVQKAELEIAKNAFLFSDHIIGQKMKPWRKVKTVSPTDALGPVLMDELHASGQNSFPVYDKTQNKIVGTLVLHDLLKVAGGGTVELLMQPDVYYLHEDQTLGDGLQAILKTHKSLFVVVNNNGEPVGALTSQDILEAVVGQPVFDDFDQYNDLQAVSRRGASKLPVENIPPLENMEEALPTEDELVESTQDLSEEKSQLENHDEVVEVEQEAREQ
jgi:CBS domain containing-hemolysin-like protein